MQKQLSNELSNKPNNQPSVAGTPQNTTGVLKTQNTQQKTSPPANNVKASGENIPTPVREINNTIQRILDKEFMRGI